MFVAIILVDPPMGDTYYPPLSKLKANRQIKIPSEPFLGAYDDFLDSPRFSSDWAFPGDTVRAGMCEDLIHYWERSIPSCFDVTNPTIESLAYYPLNIVAAEWTKYTSVMSACIKQFEYHSDDPPRLERLNTDLRELQGWRRRSMNSQQKVKSVIRQLRTRSSFSTSGNVDLENLVQDFEVLGANIELLGARLENMLPVVTSLVQIIDARRSFAETTNITRLTALALIFVPLNFVAALFSMSNEFVPGGRLFWQYWAVSVPVTLLIVVIARPPRWLIRPVSMWLREFRERWVRGRRDSLVEA